MLNLKLLFFITVLLLKSIALGEEFSYKYHYADGKECEIKNGQLIDNGVVRELTLSETKKLKKYENDLISYNEFRFNQPFRNMGDLVNYRFGLDKPQIPCFCSFCSENPSLVREQITRIDFERPSINQKLGQNEYYDSFPTPGSFGRLINNNDYEDNDVTKVFDFRSPTASDVCIIEDDVIIDGGKRREYTDEDRSKIKQYDEEVSHMIDELKEKLMKEFDEETSKPDFHENLIRVIKDHSKDMPNFPCICESCKQGNDEDNKVEPTDKPLPMIPKSTEESTGETKDVDSEENSTEKDEKSTVKDEHNKSAEESSTISPEEMVTDSSKKTHH